MSLRERLGERVGRVRERGERGWEGENVFYEEIDVNIKFSLYSLFEVSLREREIGRERGRVRERGERGREGDNVLYVEVSVEREEE